MKKVIAILLAILMMSTLTGCPGTEERSSPLQLAVVLGTHANAPMPALNSATVKDTILKCTRTGDAVATLIVDDGSPWALASYKLAPPDYTQSPTKREEIAQAQARQIVSVLSSAEAVTPEVDTLAAISLAARSLEGTSGEKAILVLDSGLSTCGYMNFSKQGLLQADGQTVVDYLRQTKALPNLSGLSMVWVGLGDVAGTQEPLTPSALESLKAIWQEVLEEAGATVTFAPDLPGGPAAEDLPYVTPVKVAEDAPIHVDVSAITFDTPIVLDEGKILFLPDSAMLADADAAVDCLQPIAEHMVAHPELKLVVTGITATAGSNDDCKVLSKQRAEAVKALMKELGVGEDRFKAVLGLGYNNPYHKPDLNPDGTLNEDIAPCNRAVYLFDAASEQAKRLIEQAG